jgi:hypothetical protein
MYVYFLVRCLIDNALHLYSNGLSVDALWLWDVAGVPPQLRMAAQMLRNSCRKTRLLICQPCRTICVCPDTDESSQEGSGFTRSGVLATLKSRSFVRFWNGSLAADFRAQLRLKM